ncbi:bifunctional 4-hydroxy-2-oxoglutarate aldolase/2-dehydro-3-deoxy-phosphogluconate aldolase [Halobacillus sp. BBL2006]|uniref:bifunctional 4-hydroxy-2-oxoglutarate aldolase/2-dehydro-3-deoxy-phosphogluconate aldolase n=1 Tax=Halobacillus sp. BBL2006 TaxID=1543706 RepID=UPI00054367AB|nr:bifunctional 4-hydroxy-2-oxoglutarate aldolase/2-dehydro-3-deoxy-phosphogluconate aldolase [Halobacillus sp. BBL2006]KHE66936.1 2-dehydro-3-deoxyphosphogluconate aldolase [Halobacillus sp. BBL2006]
MKKVEHLQKLEEAGVIAVIRRPERKDVLPLAEALVEGGVTTLEVTVDTDGAFDIIRELKKELGEQALVGAGTVLDAETAQSAISAGADFVFSPNYNHDLIQMANRYGVISIPGVLTPSEMVDAYQAGADLVKIFPASTFGPAYIKDLQGPLGHIPMIPTGGVNTENVGDYIKSGAVAVGAGGSLIDKQLIHKQDFAGITALARQFTAEVQKVREEKA